MIPDNWHEDDRLERWMAVNGVTHMGWRELADGTARITYLRADGSEVIPAQSYGYDDKLTPYTDVEGHA